MSESTAEAAEKQGLRDEYRRYTVHKILFVAGLAATIILVSGYALTLGDRSIGFWQVYEVLIDHLAGAQYEPGSSSWWDDYIIWNVRLPRILVAAVAGAGLAVGGAAMQTAVRNPLADPYTTGISSGAVLGVSVALVLGFSLNSSTGSYGIVINAFVCGLIPAVIIILISRFTATSPATLILAGIAMSYLFNALSTLLLVGASAETIQEAYLWQIGTLQNVTWNDLPIMFWITLVGSLFLMGATKKMNLLSLGDDNAKSLGLNAENFRLIVLVLLSVMTAAVIGFIGIIGFIGLVSPHIVRLILGTDNRYVLPASAFFGATFLLLADLIARTVISPGEIPVGVVMSFLGAPIFLALILHNKKGMW